MDYSRAARVPEAFWNPPPGLQALLSGAPPHWALIGLEVLRAVLAVALILGFRTRTVSVALTLTLIAGSAIMYSFSKVDHFILWELAPVMFGAAGWGSALSIDAHLRGNRGRPSGYPMFLGAMVTGFALLTAATAKVAAGWLSPDRYGALGFVVRDIADGQRVGAIAPWLVDRDLGGLWKLADYGTVFAEGWLFLAFLIPPLFRIGLVFMTFFHIGVYLLVAIDFRIYVLVYAGFFCMAPRQWLVLVSTEADTGRPLARSSAAIRPS